MMNFTHRLALVFSTVTTLSLAGAGCRGADPAVPKPQVAASASAVAGQTLPPPAAPAGATLPAGYVIGPDDVLSIVFWRDKDMSADVVVRPDGRISLPLLNDVQAAGSRPSSCARSSRRRRRSSSPEPERDRRREDDQQPQGLHHRQRREAGHVSAERRHDRAAADRGRRRTAGVRGQQEDRRHAQGRGPGSVLQLQLQGRGETEERAAEHRAEAGDTVVVP